MSLTVSAASSVSSSVDSVSASSGALDAARVVAEGPWTSASLSLDSSSASSSSSGVSASMSSSSSSEADFSLVSSSTSSSSSAILVVAAAAASPVKDVFRLPTTATWWVTQQLAALPKTILSKTLVRQDHSLMIAKMHAHVLSHFDDYRWNRQAESLGSSKLNTFDNLSTLDCMFYASVLFSILDTAYFDGVSAFLERTKDQKSKDPNTLLLQPHVKEIDSAVKFLSSELLYFNEVRPSLVAKNGHGTLKWTPTAANELYYFIIVHIWKMVERKEMNRRFVLLGLRFWYFAQRTAEFDAECTETIDASLFKEGGRAFEVLKCMRRSFLRRVGREKPDSLFRKSYLTFLQTFLMPPGTKLDHLSTYGSHKKHDLVITMSNTACDRAGVSNEDKLKWAKDIREMADASPRQILAQPRCDAHDLFMMFMFAYMFTNTTGIDFMKNYLMTSERVFSQSEEVVARITTIVHTRIPKILYRPLILCYGGRVLMLNQGKLSKLPSMRHACAFWALELTEHFDDLLEYSIERKAVSIHKFQKEIGNPFLVVAEQTSEDPGAAL